MENFGRNFFFSFLDTRSLTSTVDLHSDGLFFSLAKILGRFSFLFYDTRRKVDTFCVGKAMELFSYIPTLFIIFSKIKAPLLLNAINFKYSIGRSLKFEV